MKKKQRKVVLFGAMLAMVIGVLGIYPLHTQARTGVKFIQLNMTKKAMYVNQSMNLKVKRVTPSRASAAVIWSTSNKNVATVTQNGTVTAKNVGTAKIKAVSKNNRNVKAQKSSPCDKSAPREQGICQKSLFRCGRVSS